MSALPGTIQPRRPVTGPSIHPIRERFPRLDRRLGEPFGGISPLVMRWVRDSHFAASVLRLSSVATRLSRKPPAAPLS